MIHNDKRFDGIEAPSVWSVENNRGLRSSSSLMRRIVPITVDELFQIFRRKRNAENATSYFIFIPAKAYHKKRAHIIVVNYIIILGIFRSVYNHLLISPTDPFVISNFCAYISLTLGSPLPALELAANEKRTKTDKLSLPLMLLTRPYREYGARCKSVFAEFVIYF